MKINIFGYSFTFGMIFFMFLGGLFSVAVPFIRHWFEFLDTVTILIWFLMITPISILGGLGLYLVIFRPDIVAGILEKDE